MSLRQFRRAVDYGLLCLRHPRLLPEFFRKSRRELVRLVSPSTRARDAADRAEALRWCRHNAVDTGTAVARLTGRSGFLPFCRRFKDRLERSRGIAERCPVTMGGAGDLELIWQMAEHVEATRAIETGIAYGWSSLAFLLSLERRQGALLVSTDMPYAFKDSDRYVGCVVPSDLRHIWKVIRRPDRQALPLVLRALHQIDICHYDSDKSREGRLWAYPRLWQALRPGGVFISDDVADNLAFHDFCASVGREPCIVGTREAEETKYAGVLRKPCEEA